MKKRLIKIFQHSYDDLDTMFRFYHKHRKSMLKLLNKNIHSVEDFYIGDEHKIVVNLYELIDEEADEKNK